MRKSARMAPGLALLIVFSAAGLVQACPNCKEAIANQGGPEAQRIADGYSYSILLMMAMPFSLLGAGVFLVARAVRRGAFPEI